MDAAEEGNIGKALSLLNHAHALDPNNYKCCEMIAQVINSL